MSKVLNLDKLIPDDRYFELNKKTYKVPGALSVKEILKISKIAQEVQDHPDKMNEALSILWEILEVYNKDKSKDEFIINIKLPMLGDLIEFIFNNKGGEEVENNKDIVDNSKNESGRQR